MIESDRIICGVKIRWLLNDPALIGIYVTMTLVHAEIMYCVKKKCPPRLEDNYTWIHFWDTLIFRHNTHPTVIWIYVTIKKVHVSIKQQEFCNMIANCHMCDTTCT